MRVVLIGTDFEVRVWETLLKIPMGRATTYSDIAGCLDNPKASRAVGAAVGKNPISFVVPCHRVLGKSGALTGYHWGVTRKQAMLGWEAGQGRRHRVEHDPEKRVTGFPKDQCASNRCRSCALTCPKCNMTGCIRRFIVPL